jgi:hypothetical protein
VNKKQKGTWYRQTNDEIYERYTEGDVESDEGNMEEEEALPTTEVNQLDTVCNQSVIAICKMNIFDPPAEIVFGTWNQRELVEKEAMKLATEMTATKFSPFGMANLLPLVINKNALEASCMKTDANVEAAPMLELTEAAKAAGTKLLFAGGRHRKRATEILLQKSKTAIAEIEELISKTKETTKKGKEDKVANLEGMLEREKELKGVLGVWGIIVYDEGECSKDLIDQK